ncbi:Membrane protein involved in the export of O-antigen and teichoic acid [Hathewaya proteolytica DSM 3090]|uniref:Membrane protein involved in the export of O-antigen and teichoic acid n=1 Tax=Hathewaya proteolytica DSM 3090 TaxID=1121331 RepID=A0A1M6QUD2_9CLOT|nr:oligosaccharide flippase family protein [Hathewaya proteolytica]SHK23713.1 Membrane protein involved in the export of O-antigen and teichoic acid [Hathewaya proteolytica DSM 3090]
MSDSPKQFIKRFIGFSMGPVLSAVINFFTVSLTTYFISPAESGKVSIYAMVLSVSSMLIFLGLDQAFTRQFNSEEDKRKLFINAALPPLAVSIIIGAMGMIVYKKMSVMIIGEVDGFIMALLAISLPLTVIDRFNLLLIRMQEKAKLYSFFNIMNKLIYALVLIPYLMCIESTYKSIIIVTFLTLLAICIVEFLFTKDYWIQKIALDKKLLHEMFKYGLPLIPATVVIAILNSMDKVAIKHWSNFHEVGIYSTAMKIVSVVAIVQSAFCTFWTPTAFKWYEDKVPGEKFIKVSNMLMCIMTFMFTGIVLFKDIIIKILSPEYMAAAKVVPFLVLLPVMYTVSEATCLGISFSKKTWYNILVSISAVVVNFLCNILLVPKVGAVGASIATGFAYIVFFWMRTIISRKLWFKFKVTLYALDILCMVALGFASITINNVWLNIALSVLIIIVNYRELVMILSYGKAIINKRKNH